MNYQSAYLLVTHGSRDNRPQVGLEKLASLVRQEIRARQTNLGKDTKITDKLIGIACLELAPVSLHESIKQFSYQVQEMGVRYVHILPLFLLSGVHVTEDIPREVSLARQILGDEIKVELNSYLGSYSGVEKLLLSQFSRLPSQGRILLSHGSRRRGANQTVEAFATQLNALAAYWSVSPNLAEQIAILVARNKKTISIVPYFLFAGGITDAIAQQVQQLEQVFPETEFYLGKPLGPTPELANLIVNWLEGCLSNITVI